MRGLLQKLLYALALVCLLSSVGTAKELPQKLVIGTEGAYPPFNYLDSNGEVKGFEIDLGNAMCKRLGVKCEWFVQDWDGLIPGLLAKKYDAIIASLYITDERKKKIAFSDRYYKVPSRFVVAKDSDIKISAQGLRDKVVGVQRATAMERFMRDEMPNVELRVYGTTDEVFLDLASGRVDAILVDTVIASKTFLSKPEGQKFEMRGPEFSGTKWFGYGSGVAVRKEDAYIADAFSKVIHDMRKDGSYQKISDKWFGFDVYGSD